jgi:spermidine synthase
MVLFLAICALGVSAFITQLTLMRELLSVFAGNELILGIVLGSWLLLTGIGSYLGNTAARLRNPVNVLIVGQILIAVLPVAGVFLLRTLRDEVFIRGAAIGPTETVTSCLVLLAPYCLATGYLLTLASLILAAEKGPASIGQVYFLDNVGDIVGGLLFSFVLIHFLDHFRILYLPALLNLGFACLVALRFKRRVLLAAAATVTAELSARIQYREQRIVYKGNSPYGSLIVTESAGQYSFIENGVALFSTQNVEEVEETVHYAMAQRPDAKRVLLISGGVSGTAQEILKYDVQTVDYVELDPQIVQVAEDLLPEVLHDPRILRVAKRDLPDGPADPRGRLHVLTTDGRLFVRQVERPYRYDVVIVDVPDPSTSQLNRFYTREFFGEVKRRLAPEGVLCISLGQYAHYLSPQLARLVAVGHETLRQEFSKVMIIPAERTGRIFYLASEGPLTDNAAEIAARLEQRAIPTRLIRRPYLRDALAPDRLADVRRAISDEAPVNRVSADRPPRGTSPDGPKVPVNRDFSPILYYYHLLYWMSQFQVSFGLLQGGLLLLLVICLVRIRPVSLAIFTTGLAASALEVVLLVAFQILYGCLYRQVGLIVAMFMLGLGIGSFTMNRLLPKRSRKDLARLEFLVAVYAACLPLVLIGLGRIGNPAAAAVASQVAIPLLSLLLAVLVGLEFPLAGKADFRTVTSTAARLYTADYLGAALGALIVSTLLIPVMGVVAVCLLAAGLNLVSGAVIFWTSRN